MRRSLCGSLLCLLWVCARAWGFNAPEAADGPLRVRIQGPASVTAAGIPQPVRVVLTNSAARPLACTVKLTVVDRWLAEPGTQSVTIPPHGCAVAAFNVTAGAGTYSALYPIHATVSAVDEGQPLLAHPILILETRLPDPPAPPVERRAWQPLAVPGEGRVLLADLRVLRVAFSLFDRAAAETMPVGWLGGHPTHKGHVEACRPVLDGRARPALGGHVPWWGTAGRLLIEYPLILPAGTPARLTFAHGLQLGHRGDGITFRVRVAPLAAPDGTWGAVAFQRHVTTTNTWVPGSVDLGAYAGQQIRLQLECDPGPARNTGWDLGYWAEPKLLTGATPAEDDELLSGPPAAVKAVELGTAGSGAHPYRVRIWPGRRGLLDATFGFESAARSLYARGLQVQVAGVRLDRSDAFPLVSLEQRAVRQGLEVRHRFAGSAGSFDLLAVAQCRDGRFEITLALEKEPAPVPWRVTRIEDLALGEWGATARQVYAGLGNVIRDPGVFELPFDGHRLASSFVGLDFPGVSVVLAVNATPDTLRVDPGARHYALHTPGSQTLSCVPAPDVWTALSTWRAGGDARPAGGVKRLAGRFVFDLWGGDYGKTAAELKSAFRYGLTDAAVVFHNWQRWGYDYRLPDIWPPQPERGTAAELRELADTCRDAGVLFAPHDNYIDIYPDADDFSYERHVAFDASGRPVRAWLNEGRDAQSYRFRADAVEPFVRRNLALIRKGLAPTGYFIDVWSSIAPYDYWTADGRFVPRPVTAEIWGKQFAWIRDMLGGAPQISESGHDRLVGWLDGGQANMLRVGAPGGDGRRSWCVWNIPHGDAERTPWLDAAYHDVFVLHGAGYSDRYEGGLPRALHGIFSDDYICTEVLSGHPAMAPQAFGRDVVRKYWLLADLGRALAGQRIASVEYVGDDLHRQRVSWSNGAVVHVNRGTSDWAVAGCVLPPFGFHALVPAARRGAAAVEASLARTDGLIVERSATPGRLYVNGRRLAGDRASVWCEVTAFRGEGRAFSGMLTWRAETPIPAGWRPFLHFCDAEGEILFQGWVQQEGFDREQRGTFTTPFSGTLPEGSVSGLDVELRGGVFQPTSGQRLAIAGEQDGDRRWRHGRVQWPADGAAPLWSKPPQAPDPVLARANPAERVVDFGAIATADGCRIEHKGEALLVTPLPGGRAGAPFVARVAWARLPWKLPKPVQLVCLSAYGKTLRTAPAVVAGDGAVVVECSPDVFQVRVGP